MANLGLRGVVERLRRGLADRESDGDLLERYIAHRDEETFAELVERHGPRVYAVCRRVLGQHHLAEDAYQATFVVLARKACGLRLVRLEVGRRSLPRHFRCRRWQREDRFDSDVGRRPARSHRSRLIRDEAQAIVLCQFRRRRRRRRFGIVTRSPPAPSRGCWP